LSWIVNTGALAKNVTVGMGNYKPYYIAEGKTGIFTDLVKAVFRYIPNYEPEFIFGRPNKRLWIEFKQGKVDGIANLPSSEELGGCKTNPVFRFRDVAVTIASKNLTISNVSDLTNKRIVTFQGAKKFMGKEFSENTKFKAYHEVANQQLQARMLYGGRADVSVGDIFLFLQSLNDATPVFAKSNEFRVHDIFPVFTTRMGFREKAMCLLFNKGLEKVRSSGEYEKIYTSYLEMLGYKD